MDYTPACLSLLLLSSLFAPWQGAEAQSRFTIDSVTLSVDPSGEISTGTFVDMNCQVIVSHDSSVPLAHSFNLLHNDVVVFSKNTTDDALFYQLMPARAANSGTYMCRVTVQNKSKGSISKKLVVTGLQTPVLLVNPEMPFEGEEVMATCHALEESGSFYFYFYQDFEQIKQVRASGNMVETKLEMKYAGDKHLHCDYEIVMIGNTQRSNNSNTVKVTVKELFITPVMNILPGENVIEGDVVDFVCKVVSPPFPVSVFLTKDKKMLKEASTNLTHRLRVLAEDSGEYVCKAERGNLLREAYKSIRVKDLFSKPLLKMKPREVFEGEVFTLNCSSKDYSSERINSGDVKYSLFWNQVLLTSGGYYNATAHLSLNGNYSCQAYALDRGQNQVFKSSNQIVLKAKVPVSVPRVSVVGDRLILGKPFQLQCLSENGSLPITYILVIHHRQVKSRVVNSPGDLAIFNLTSIHSITDLQSFSCKAQNHPNQPPRESSGEYLRRIANIIVPVSKPELSMMPTKVAEGQDLTLTCTVQRGTPPITYTWYHSALPMHSITINVMQGSYIIRSVGQEHGGEYYCITSNPSNDTERSGSLIVEVKLAPWKIFLIAVFCILLTVAIIVFIFVKKGLLPFRRKRTGDLSVKPASTKTDETLRLTHGTGIEAANATPGVMGRNVWSDNVSGSESDDQRSEGIPEVPDIEYTEVQPQEADPGRAPVKKGTETVYSEVRNSMQGVLKPEQADSQGSVEYAQLNNHDHESEEQEHEPSQDQQ